MAKLTIVAPHMRSEMLEFRQIIDEMNGHISFGTAGDGEHGANIDVEFQTHTFGGTPDTEESIAHTLGRKPVGFIVINIDRAAIVYADNEAGWTATTILLKCNTASAVADIMLI